MKKILIFVMVFLLTLCAAAPITVFAAGFKEPKKLYSCQKVDLKKGGKLEYLKIWRNRSHSILYISVNGKKTKIKFGKEGSATFLAYFYCDLNKKDKYKEIIIEDSKGDYPEYMYFRWTGKKLIRLYTYNYSPETQKYVKSKIKSFQFPPKTDGKGRIKVSREAGVLYNYYAYINT